MKIILNFIKMHGTTIKKWNFCYEIWLLSVALCSTRFLNLQGDITELCKTH
jgi:hypothetical protein